MKKIYFFVVTLCVFSSVNSQIINFPDANFKAKLLAYGYVKDINYQNFNLDSNSDGEIQVSEALNVYKFSYIGTSVNTSPIGDLTGINYFTNLRTLEIWGSDTIKLTSLNISNLNNLTYLDCYNNQLTSLDVSNLNNLTRLFCSHNSLNSLLVPSSLIVLECHYNSLTTLDLSSTSQLVSFRCDSNNLLKTLFLKNGNNETGYPNSFFSGCALEYICADDDQIAQIMQTIQSSGCPLIRCNVNSYCSFVPGGTYYLIQGNNKLDINGNGCDVLDLSFPNLRYNITNGTNTGSLISNASGNYSIPVKAGTHTITPVLENPSYFVISPTNAVITFPTQASPFTRDFCVTANGVHPDLEISLLPINAARPGFDSTYKIIYKNKGNTTQSGTVNIAFNDAVLDFVSSNPVTTSQSINNLYWTFTNLLPFETREITFTLNVNSPTETPAVNGGDVLNYTATITSIATDDMPSDNTFVLNQTVVNSFDPNDKTCLEGTTISPTKVGDYVHYMIRFENNGTANAQNIVVKDMIDTAKFDINSIVPTKGSHSFVTNITAGNKVEFIFENINLPFDDANNDGYVTFKIKTKPTLVLGNTFSNTASIYFDYNFPIVTNTATTTIAALAIQDFEFSNYFSLFPNPVNNVLNINTKESVKITSINIYNTLGQLVLVIPNAENTKTVDVSSLSSGNYFIKINSDKGTSNTKFIKQ